ncbi:MAG: EAL domain-containing protein [Chloroflexota bacterium]
MKRNPSISPAYAVVAVICVIAATLFAAWSRSAPIVAILGLATVLMLFWVARLWQRRTGDGTASEAYFRSLVESSMLPAAALSPDGKLVAVNQGLLNLLNLEHQDVAADSSALFRAFETDVLFQQIRNALDRPLADLNSTHRLEHADRTIVARLNGVRAPWDQQEVLIITLQDITETEKFEAQRARNEMQLGLQRAAALFLAQSSALEDTVGGLLAIIGQYAGWDAAIFWRAHPDQPLASQHTWSRNQAADAMFVAEARKRTLERRVGPAGQAFTQHDALWISNVEEYPRSLHTGKALNAGLHSAACFPLDLGGETYGVMEFLGSERREYDEVLSFAIREVVEQCSQAMERIRLEEPLRSTAARYQTIAQNSGEGIIIINPAGVIEFANEAVERIFGYTQRELIGSPLTMLMSEAMREGHEAGLRRYTETGTRRLRWEDLEFTGLRRDGTEILLRISITETGEGADRAFAGFVRDVTDEKREQSTLAYHAMHDALTDLPNRSLLLERTTRAILAAHRQRNPVALVIMDLDRFKDVNDTFGHDYGDQLLRQVSGRLTRVLRQSDSVARLGGDEFALLLPATDFAGAEQAAQRIMQALHNPFVVKGQSFTIGSSMGIAMYPNHGEDTSTLMRRADVAMYAAKRGGTGHAFYSEDRDEISSVRLLLTRELKEAIEHDQLVLQYQPKVNLIDGRTEHVEALVRWQHPERGFTFPDYFIPLAEESGLIKPLTLWVLNEALRQHRVWKEQGVQLRVAVNVSARVLHDPELLETVHQLLKTWDVEPSNLEVEITESAIMVDPEQAKKTLTDLHTAGVWTSIDDFGTGHSSLAYLRHLPFDEIKIDKSFVLEMATDRSDASIVRSVVALGHNFELKVVAEGVDNKRTMDMLAEMGCDMAQGYFLSKAIHAADLPEWIASYEKQIRPTLTRVS